MGHRRDTLPRLRRRPPTLTHGTHHRGSGVWGKHGVEGVLGKGAIGAPDPPYRLVQFCLKAGVHYKVSDGPLDFSNQMFLTFKHKVIASFSNHKVLIHWIFEYMAWACPNLDT